MLQKRNFKIMKTVTYDETKCKLVPIEPTEAMQYTGAKSIRFDTTHLNKIWSGNATYRAMIAVVPEPLLEHPAPDALAIVKAALEESARSLYDGGADGDIYDVGYRAQRIRAINPKSILDGMNK
jgi:hypothetical protein